MDSKDRKIEQLEQFVEKLIQRISELELELAVAKKDSSNSSKSPVKKKRVRGKQEKRQRREMLPPERVDEAFEYDMDEDEVRRLGLTATDEFEVVQKIELCQTPIHVTEHRLRVYLTPDGKRTTASVPEAPDRLSGTDREESWFKSARRACRP